MLLRGLVLDSLHRFFSSVRRFPPCNTSNKIVVFTCEVSRWPASPLRPRALSAWFIMANRRIAIRCRLSAKSRQYVPVGLPTNGAQACEGVFKRYHEGFDIVQSSVRT